MDGSQCKCEEMHRRGGGRSGGRSSSSLTDTVHAQGNRIGHSGVIEVVSLLTDLGIWNKLETLELNVRCSTVNPGSLYVSEN